MKQDLDKLVREAVKKSGISWYRLALNTGISNAAISRFMNKKQTLTLRSAGRLLAALDIRVELIQGANHGKRN